MIGWTRHATAAAIAILIALAAIPSASAIGADPTCPSAELFGGGIVSKVCWNCFFPIRVAGVPYGDASNVPIGAASSVCVCPGRIFGTPTPGVTLGMWQPRHLLEVVRKPYCSPTLGKSLAGSAAGAATASNVTKWGGYGAGGEKDHSAFYNVHYFLFPLALVLDQMQDAVCVSDAGGDMDLLFMTEIDPLWNNDELGIYTTPEAVLFANPVAIAACLADAAQASVWQPNPLLFWCAGTWGHLYPFTGQSGEQDSPPKDTSLTATKGLAMLHRIGIAQKRMGDDAVCHDHPDPMLPKNQYKFQTLHPIPELLTNHWIGASTFRWGEWRNLPAVGEDFVYLEWSWSDCCMNF
ncbi:MAG TPA: TraU family protein [Rhodanobacteraceae bacterium]|nr:TraU family protein [Rhodanobacteraceae bacterium]